MMTNKAKQLREALGLTQKQMGELFTDQKGDNAKKYWSRLEASQNPVGITRTFFDVVLTLKMAEDLQTPDSKGALKMVLEVLKGY